jgi:hypothetical protein
VCVVLAALAGCGGSGKGGAGSTASSVAPGAPAPSVTATAPVATATQTTPAQTTPSPEQQQGGTGDEQPISTQAEFTGNGGDITPATIRVPPFIAVKVVLHSADGGTYGLEVAHHQLNVDASNPTASVQLSGLRAGKRYAVDVTGAPERLSIVAKAEPGP